jgi:hypothetical protein
LSRMRKWQHAAIMAALVAAIFVSGAQAQQPAEPPVDPRLAGPAIKAMQAMLALREAEARAMVADQQEREKAWQETFKGWCGGRPACGLAPPAVASQEK